MDEFDYYSVDQIEDMEFQGWEDPEKSDSELIEELDTITALNAFEGDPHIDLVERVIREKIERRGLVKSHDFASENFRADAIRLMDNDNDRRF